MRNFIKIITENEDNDWQIAVEAQDWKEAFFHADTPEQVIATLKAADARKITFDFAPKMPPIYMIDEDIVEWDGKSQYAEIENAQQWVYNINVSDYFPDVEDDFNNNFWNGPSELYHATIEENVEEILAHGLKCMNKTRGLDNRGVGCAIFTTSNYEETMEGSYGDQVFTINTAAMKQDGLCPYVGQEPPVLDAECRNTIAHHIGLNDFYPDEHNDMSGDTVIVYGEIPAKYLTLESS